MKKVLILIVIIAFLGFETDRGKASKGNAGKVKVMLLYPNEEGKSFDINYYSKKHMPMVAAFFGDALKGYGIEKGVDSTFPKEKTPHVAIGYFLFDSVEDYYNSFGPNTDKILNDIPNYTSIQPVIQITEIVH
ncbi:MAG: EthD family reductase [Croceivirga sp.]